MLIAPRRPAGAATTSSSSAANADEPRTPLGLGVRWVGEPEPELGVSPALAFEAEGRAMGAMGRATGPGSELSIGMEPRRVGASIAGVEEDEASGCMGVFVLGGGPIGVTGVCGIPARVKAGSKGRPLLKFRGIADGARPLPGGGWRMLGPGPPTPKPKGEGANEGTRGDI